jgi:hypothetical protein
MTQVPGEIRMGSTNSTKNASKISAVKALAKGLIGKRKESPKDASKDSHKDTKKKGGAAPAAKAAVAKKPNGKVAASPASHKSSMKTSASGNKENSKKTAAPAKATAPAKTAAAAKAAAPTAKAGAAPKAATAKASKKSGSYLGGRGSADAEAVCREVACEGLSTTAGYCRLHYIKNWKKIKRKELILKEGKLNQYIEELVAKYPDKYIEAIRQDLANDKDFAKVIYDLDLDESVDDFDVEGENVDSLIDTIKRDFDDEGEGGF